MRRMVRGSVALLLGALVLCAGSAALAQETTTTTLPLHPITVTPNVVDEPKEKITLSGPGFPDQLGCKFGSILALEEGQQLSSETKVLLAGDFDAQWETQVDRWEDRTYFTAGVYTLLLVCRDDSGGAEQTFRTGARLTVEESGVPAPDPTTPPVEPGGNVGTTTTTTASTQGTVDPSTARAGETTVTVRGNGFKPLADLEISLNSTPKTVLGTTRARENGEYAATILIPATAPAGQHKLLVTGPGPDGVTRSTSADLMVLAATGTGAGTRSRTAAATGSAGSAAGELPATGPNERTPYLVMAALTAMTLGAFLVGMSHPAIPSGGRHRRRRHGLHRR